jgi:hypothetical protein
MLKFRKKIKTKSYKQKSSGKIVNLVMFRHKNMINVHRYNTKRFERLMNRLTREDS